MKPEIEVFPVDTKDLNTAEKIKAVISFENNKDKRVFIGYLEVSGKINKIE